MNGIYEYKDITVSRNIALLYTENYGSFGWELENVSTPSESVSSVTMRFKRGGKIRNKTELTRLGRYFDSLTGEIDALKRKPVIGRKKTEQVARMIDGKYEKVREVCKKASGLSAK